MADELKRVGLVFKADGTVDFNKSLKEVNASIQENRTAFNLVKSTWDENTKSLEKLKATQEYLTKQTKDYTDKAEMLERQLKELESAEERDERAIQAKKSQLNQAKTSLNNYKRGLENVEEKLKSGAYKTELYTQKLDEFGEKAQNAGDKLSGVSTAAAGVLAGVTALVPATEEYRKIMASLESSSELAGYTAEETRQTYEKLFGVLGDDQTSATTTANLQALGLSQKELTQLTDGTIGAWAKYGDSIPIDGLAEAINETVKVGQVTGTFADVLNWAGTSEDEFNERLASCGSESERANLIMQELARQGLTEAGEKWQENNKNLIEGNKATADMKEATAELAETVAPIVTEVTEIASDLLNKFNSLPESAQAAIAVMLLLIAASSPLISTIGNISTGLSSLIGFMGGGTAAAKTLGTVASTVMGGIGKGASALFGIISANPVIAIIMAIIAVIVLLYNKCEWFRDGADSIIGSVVGFFLNFDDNVEKVKGSVVQKFEDTKSAAIGIFDDIKNGIKEKVEWARDKVEGAIEAIKGFFDFEWSLPKIKLPHLKITGGFNLMPPEVPEFDIKWYANGGILNRPTIFGKNGDNLMGGGEAGPEAVLPINLLKQYIRDEMQQNNLALADLLEEAVKNLKINAENNIYIGDKRIYQIIAEMVIKEISSKVGSQRASKGVSYV